jgi:predicted CXXCH cytochrome family protein
MAVLLLPAMAFGAGGHDSLSCTGCHGIHDAETGNLIFADPYGIKPNPKVAKVPSSLLRNGKLECIGCHDPHPSNPNKKYVRVGGNMQDFCSLCHSSKSGKKISTAKIFSSMNEGGSAPAKRPAGKKPASGKR